MQIVGDRLRVTAQLILGSDGTHLWSHAFTFASSERRELQDALIDIMLRSLKPGVPVLAATLASQHYARMYVESGGQDADAFFLHAMAVAGNQAPQIMSLPASPLFKKYHRDARWRVLLETLKFPQPLRIGRT